MTKHKNREDWLEAAVVALEKEFFPALGVKMPKKWRIACSFPHRAKGTTIGQCFLPEAASDGETVHMLVAPKMDDAFQTIQTVLHEMIHAVTPGDGHKKNFRKHALAVGFTTPMTRTPIDPESDLEKRLKKVLRSLGRYPHVAIVPPEKPLKPPKWVRFRSIILDKYSVAVNVDQALEHGAPKDPTGADMIPANARAIAAFAGLEYE